MASMFIEALAATDCPICLERFDHGFSTSGPSPPLTSSLSSSPQLRSNFPSCKYDNFDDDSMRSHSPTDFAGHHHHHPVITNALSSPSSFDGFDSITGGGNFSYVDPHGIDGPYLVIPGADNDTVVLSCGHFVHSMCLRRLASVEPNPRKLCCPVCRHPIKGDNQEVVLFRPQTRPPRMAPAAAPGTTAPQRGAHGRRGEGGDGEPRPKAAVRGGNTAAHDASRRDHAGGASPPVEVIVDVDDDDADDGEHVSNSSNSSSSARPPLDVNGVEADGEGCEPALKRVKAEPQREDDEGDDSDEIMVVSTRQVPMGDAYRDFLQRSTAVMQERSGVLKERELQLQSSLTQLGADCAEVERNAAELRERSELLTGRRDSGAGAHHERRRVDLLRACKETKAACDAATAELAAAGRENAELQRYLESYARKMHRLENGEEKPTRGDLA